MGLPVKEDRECSLRGKSDNVITMLSLSRFELEARFIDRCFSCEIEVKSSGDRSISSSHWRLGIKALCLEPLLIVGASLLWLAVLPLAAIVWFGTTLTKRASA